MRALSLIPDLRGRALQAMLARDAYTRRLEAETVAILQDAFAELTHDLERLAPTLKDRGRQAMLWRAIGQRLQDAYGEVSAFTSDQAAQLAAIEVDAARAEIANQIAAAGGALPAASTGILTSDLVQSIATFPIEGLPLGDWWQSQGAALAVASRRTLQVGLVKGESTEQLVARIMPPRETSAPAVWRQARAQARTVVRTATNAIYNDSAMRGYESVGEDVSGEYELSAVRDKRTTRICASLDGRRYRYDDPNRKVPPFHMGCRTTTLPVINYAALGLTEPAGRGTLTFQSYDAWLRGQSRTAQNEVLGPARADAWRAGSLSLQQLVDDDNRELTLDQLDGILTG